MDSNNNQTSSTIDNDKLWSILAYVFFLLPLIFVKNKSQTLIFHVNQGIILTIVALIGAFGLDLLPFWFKILVLVKWIWNIFVLALLVTGIKNVIYNEQKTLPFVGNLFTFLK
jgi:hypothetical protein